MSVDEKQVVLAEEPASNDAEQVVVIVPAPVRHDYDATISTAVCYFKVKPDKNKPWTTQILRGDEYVDTPAGFRVEFASHQNTTTDPIELQLQALQRIILIGEMDENDSENLGDWRFHDKGVIYCHENDHHDFRVNTEVTENGNRLIMTIDQVTDIAFDRSIAFRYLATCFETGVGQLPAPVYYSQDPVVSVGRVQL